MPTAIVAGLPPEIERRIRAALREGPSFQGWSVVWFRSKSRIPGLAPSQLPAIKEAASTTGGAHILVFRGRESREKALVTEDVAPYFRLRWLDPTLLRLIPNAVNEFVKTLAKVLEEELEWNLTVKPQDESCCLLLPECAFVASVRVRHVWTAAGEAGIERIRSAARVAKEFRSVHWLANKDGKRAWIDIEHKVFDHLGARRGRDAPFPRSWKLSHPLPPGFHFDITSKDSRPFAVGAADGRRHNILPLDHLNMDPHGYVTH